SGEDPLPHAPRGPLMTLQWGRCANAAESGVWLWEWGEDLPLQRGRCAYAAESSFRIQSSPRSHASMGPLRERSGELEVLGRLLAVRHASMGPLRAYSD